MRKLVIHDTRTFGVCVGSILTRLWTEEGHQVDAYFGRRKTFDTRQFWQEAQSVLAPRLQDIEQLVLCCVTFDDDAPDRCQETLKWLSDEGKLQILSHRWPDGYQQRGWDVKVPPLSLTEEYSTRLTARDRDLLRLCLVNARDADLDRLTAEDKTRADDLADQIWPRSPATDADEAVWQAYEKEEAERWKDLCAARMTVERPADQEDREDLAIDKDMSPECTIYRLSPAAKDFPERALEMLADADRPRIAFGLVGPKPDRVYSVRPWFARRDAPSIEYLLSKFGKDTGLQSELWRGRQDVKYLRLEQANISGEVIRERLRTFAKKANDAWGERGLPPWLGWMLHRVGRGLLQKLDPRGDRQSDVDLDPTGARILIDRGHRSPQLRRTIVLRLIVKTLKGAVFVFGHEGYNFVKLERTLEGALVGLSTVDSVWFGLMTIPTRLRIDVQMSKEATDQLGREGLAGVEVESVPLDAAIGSGWVERESSLDQALQRYGGSSPSLILFRGSETIGPSVPYGIAAYALAKALSTVGKRSRPLAVLDLFSGSGFVAKVLRTALEGRVRVWCVDAWIDGAEAGLDGFDDVVWLRARAEDVLGVTWRGGDRAKRPILGCVFDLACMDPPHGLVLEMVYSQAFIEKVRQRAKWLVVYHGHWSQRGRGRLIGEALQGFGVVEEWEIGSELVLVAGPSSDEAEAVLTAARATLDSFTRDNNWAKWQCDYRRVGPPPLSD